MLDHILSSSPTHQLATSPTAIPNPPNPFDFSSSTKVESDSDLVLNFEDDHRKRRRNRTSNPFFPAIFHPKCLNPSPLQLNPVGHVTPRNVNVIASDLAPGASNLDSPVSAFTKPTIHQRVTIHPFLRCSDYALVLPSSNPLYASSRTSPILDGQLKFNPKSSPALP